MNKLDLTLDYHSHILPRCDHGSDGLDTSLRQLSMAADAGVQTICATPHFYPSKESVSSFLARRQNCWETLSLALPPVSPKILLGAEVLICDGMEHMEGLSRLCLQGTNELLLEMPFYRWPESLWETLSLLIDLDDIRVVIAHADRYPPEDIRQLIQAGVPLQLNASCLTHPFTRRQYLSWIRDGYVRYLGSDIHMLGKGYRDWQQCRKLLGKQS